MSDKINYEEMTPREAFEAWWVNNARNIPERVREGMKERTDSHVPIQPILDFLHELRDELQCSWYDDPADVYNAKKPAYDKVQAAIAQLESRLPKGN